MPLTWLPYIGYAMQFVAAMLAWAVARRRRFHRTFAYFVLALAFSDAARGLLIRPVLMRLAIPDMPYSGLGRALFHLDQALTMLPRVGLMLVTWKMVRENIAAHLAGASALAWVAICVNYPWLNGRAVDGGTLQVAYLGVFLVCQFATWSAMVKMLSARASALLPTQSLLIATAAADLALIVGPFAGNIFTDWRFSAGTYFALQTTTIVVHAAWLAGLRPPVASGSTAAVPTSGPRPR